MMEAVRAGAGGDPEARRMQAALARNLAAFRHLLARAHQAATEGRDEHAAVLGEAAAAFATANHCGLFSSPELERLVTALGRRLAPHPVASRAPPRSSPDRVLHVLTEARIVGGSSRMAWRWIAQDRGRRHSVALTRQDGARLPAPLVAAVLASGGAVHRLDGAGLLARARQLAALGREADLAVVHTEQDAVPLLAFADPARSPPTLFVDHGDHKFRLGLAASTVVASMRESGQRHARRRRDVDPARNPLLPTLLDAAPEAGRREEARRALGLPAEARILLSIARGTKFGAPGSPSYADRHLSVLEADPAALLVVVGAGTRPDWQAAAERSGGRIVALDERPDTAPFYDAADIYVDSFPFVSITSLLEAGSRGLPLVSCFPHAPEAEIFGADMPGLTGCLRRAGAWPEYQEILAGLLADGAERRALGLRTRASIAAVHTGEGWMAALERAYALAAREHGPFRAPRPDDGPAFDPVDLIVPLVCPQGHAPEQAIAQQLRIYPLWARLKLWLALARGAGPDARIGRSTLACFLPPAALARLRAAMARRRSARACGGA
ncbi:glycosyl transferase family 1 [Methylobacterium terrae]|uniref:Glycosyl transferase family 1 n=1 Tax=Methylobacterium terrae TaxID=2202827 RepID=A0A2U8WM78_9HYPH|nr:glycosyl transferase family 1 [Methylobacterium terrae]AWN47364.1 glycosyl transferase family 1 [Methylobacterium terrae]